MVSSTGSGTSGLPIYKFKTGDKVKITPIGSIDAAYIVISKDVRDPTRIMVHREDRPKTESISVVESWCIPYDKGSEGMHGTPQERHLADIKPKLMSRKATAIRPEPPNPKPRPPNTDPRPPNPDPEKKDMPPPRKNFLEGWQPRKR